MPLSALLQQYSPILPILAFLFFFKKIRGWHLWVIFFYCLYSFANDYFILDKVEKGLSIKIQLYIFTVIEYTVFAFFLGSILENELIKKILVGVSIAFVVFCFYQIYAQTIKVFDSLQTAMGAIILIAFCIAYLYEQINKPQLTFIYASPQFWMVMAILIFLAGTFFLFVFAANLPKEEARQYWIINHISNILKNILFSVAIVVYGKPPKTPKIQKPNEYDYQPYLN
jgi:hypothetical protein